MTREAIIKNTFKKFYASIAVATIGTALMGLFNILIASLCFGGNGEYTMGIALPIVILTETIVYFFGVGGGIAASVKQGEGDIEHAQSIFSLSVLSTFCIGILAALVGNLLLPQLMPLLGAQTAAEQAIVTEYLRILFFGMPFTLLVGVMTVFIRNDNSPRFAMLGIVISILTNLVLLALFIGVLELPVYTIALATVIANAVCAILYAFYFLSKKSTIKFSAKLTASSFRDIFAPGFSGSMIFLAQTLLTVIINRILLDVSGTDGIAVYAIVKYAITFIYGIYDSVNHSAQPMFSVYYGEKDQFSTRETARIAAKFMIIGSLLLAVAQVILGIFFFEKNISVAIILIGISCLFSWSVAFLNSYYRSTGKSKLSVLYIVLDNLIFPAAFVCLFVYGMKLGETGVWLSLLVSELVTILLMLCISRGNVLLLSKTEENKDHIYETLILNQETDIIAINSEIEEFCERHEISPKKQYYIFLCIEEIAVNIIKHGFTDGKEHYIDIKLKVNGDDVMLNIRDDAIGFDPTKKADADITLSAEERDIGGLGIYLVKKISKEFSYKRVIGFNNLHIVL